MTLQPRDIISRRFPRKPLGVDPVALHVFLVEVAAAMEQMTAALTRADLEKVSLQDSLTQAAAKAAEMENQVAPLQTKLAAYREQESLISRAIQRAQRYADEQAAARTAADDTIAAARATAQEFTRAAQMSAEETLEATQRRVAELLEEATRTAAARAAAAQAEADRVAEAAQRRAAEIRETAERYVAALVAKVDALARHQEGFVQTLETSVTPYAEHLKTMRHLHQEINAALPGLTRLFRELDEGHPGGVSSSHAGGRVSEMVPAPAPAEAASATGSGDAGSTPAAQGPAEPPTPETPVVARR